MIKSIAEFYEYGVCHLAMNRACCCNGRIVGRFIGTQGHELDHENFAFMFINDQLGGLTVPAYDYKSISEHRLNNNQVSYLNPLLHEIIVCR